MPAKLSNEEAWAVMHASDFKPLENYPGSVKPWKSECLRCGEIVKPRLNAVKSGKRQCGFCSGARVKESTAIQIMNSAGLTPLEAFPGSKRSWMNRCNVCRRVISPSFANVNNGHAGCAYCEGKKVDSDSAVSLMLANFLEPLEPFVSSRSKWKCKCLMCESEVTPTYGDIKQGQGGCHRCGIVKRANKQKLGSEFALAKMRQAGVEPLDEYSGYDQPWRSRCMSCKHEISPRLHSIISGQGACKYCSGRYLDPIFAELVMSEAGLITCEPFPGNDKPWKCICSTCKRKISPRYGNIRSGSGCRYCNAVSFESDKPGIVYLMTNPTLGAHKIGITNSSRKSRLKSQPQNPRIEEHRKSGWQVFRLIEYKSGLSALEVEQGVLSWLRTERKLSAFLAKEQMPQGGYTETFDSTEIDLPVVWAKVEELSWGK